MRIQFWVRFPETYAVRTSVRTTLAFGKNPPLLASRGGATCYARSHGCLRLVCPTVILTEAEGGVEGSPRCFDTANKLPAQHDGVGDVSTALNMTISLLGCTSTQNGKYSYCTTARGANRRCRNISTILSVYPLAAKRFFLYNITKIIFLREWRPWQPSQKAEKNQRH